MKKAAVVLLILVVLFVGCLYWALSHHVVSTKNGLVILQKRFLTFKDTYTDIRSWSSDGFDAHPDLKRALIDQGYSDLLIEVKSAEVKAALQKMATDAEAGMKVFQERIQQQVDDWLRGRETATEKK